MEKSFPGAQFGFEPAVGVCNIDHKPAKFVVRVPSIEDTLVSADLMNLIKSLVYLVNMETEIRNEIKADRADGDEMASMEILNAMASEYAESKSAQEYFDLFVRASANVGKLIRDVQS